MAGIANLIGGAGQAAGQLGSQVRAQNFAHQENSLKQLQEQYNNLADAVERQKTIYSAAPDIVDKLNDVEMQIRAAHSPGNPVDPKSYQKLLDLYVATKQQAQKDWLTHAANPGSPINQTTPAVRQAIAQATGQGGVQPVGAATTPPPFAPQIAQPSGPPAAQPATSPVQPAAQGGGNSSPAAFPTAPVPPVDAGAAAAQPTAADTSVPTLTASTGGASVAPVVPLDDLLARSMAGYQDTGIMSPQLNAALGHQMATQADLEKLYRSGGVNLQLGKNKVEAIQPYLQDMQENPAHFLQDLIPIETIAGGNAAMALGPLLAALTPQSEPGMTTAGSLEATHPGFLASQGLTGLDPNTPVRVQVNKFTRMPVSAQVSSVAERPITGAEGTFNYNPRLGKVGDNLGITPIGMAPTTSVQNVPGQLPQTTTRTKGAPAKTAPSTPGALPPVRPSGGAGGGGAAKAAPAGSSNSVIANNYNDWMAGKATLSDKEQTAARSYAQQHGLPTPELLSPGGLEAIKNIQPILDEILHARQLLRDEKLIGSDTRSQLDSKERFAKGYAKYQHLHMGDPLTSAISDLSFDRIRSVGQALQGTGSRAFPIFNMGLEHTPVIGLNSDPGSVMDEKLAGMQRRAEESIKMAHSMTKSGVLPIQPVQGAPANRPAPKTAEEYLQQLNAR